MTAAVLVAATAGVVNVKVLELAPPEMETDAGPPQVERLDFSLTVRPAPGAAELSFTVPVVGAPPTRELGLNDREVSLGAWIVSVAEAEPFPNLPLITAEAFAEIAEIVTVNATEVAPPGTVTDAGTLAAEIEELSVTTAPSEPAFDESFTVPVELAPPATVEGESVRAKPEA